MSSKKYEQNMRERGGHSKKTKQGSHEHKQGKTSSQWHKKYLQDNYI